MISHYAVFFHNITITHITYLTYILPSNEHKSSECNEQNLCCVNCKIVADKFKLDLNYAHNAYRNKCPTLMTKIDRFARNFRIEEKNSNHIKQVI